MTSTNKLCVRKFSRAAAAVAVAMSSRLIEVMLVRVQIEVGEENTTKGSAVSNIKHIVHSSNENLHKSPTFQALIHPKLCNAFFTWIKEQHESLTVNNITLTG